MANSTKHGLPVIPLSPIAQSFILCKNAIAQASEKLTEAKQVRPHLGVDVIRGFLETVKLERHRLDTLSRKMQSVESATCLFWDADALARQISIIDCQLYSNVLLDKSLLSQLDTEGAQLDHLVDFHNYLTNSFAHQLIFWVELIKPENTGVISVVPSINHSKDSLITHLVRVAYLLLHAYRDFSGFAAIMKAINLPEVKRLQKRLWINVNSKTKEMYRELTNIISVNQNYQEYYSCLKQKLNLHHSNGGGMMIAIPWIQPHLLSIRSIVTAYTAGDDNDQQHILSTPGENKLNFELSILELCQHNSVVDNMNQDQILSLQDTKKMRSSTLAKAIHIEGLRAAVLPITNLNHLAYGDQLAHHWIVSRVYLTKDQLISESMEVQALKSGESIICDKDDFEEAMTQQAKYLASRPVSLYSDSDSDNDSGATVELPLVTPEEVVTTVITASEEEDEVFVDLDAIIKERVAKENATLKEAEQMEEEEQLRPVEEPVLEVELQTLSIKEEEEEDIEEEDIIVEIVKEGKEVESIKVEPAAIVKEEPVKQEDIEILVAPAQELGVVAISTVSSSNSSSKQKSRLSPSAPVFVPSSVKIASSISTDEKWNGYPADDTESEKWNGYPTPVEEDEEVWKGYPGPNSSIDSPRRASSQSETSEEWKGYHATKEEADWQRESEQMVQEQEWQGYALETLDEDELDSSTMMDGEFEKSRQARTKKH